jgi:DNA-binding response OmpR family regulator
MHVLIIDDAPDIREILEIVLGSDGWEVSLAASLAEAESFLAQNKPDLILVDYQLPDGDGVTGASGWKDKSIPMVLYTGAEKQTEPGLFVDVITKNIDPFELSKRLQSLLG